MNGSHRKRNNQQAYEVTVAHGKLGERLAADYLQRTKGFTICARNWRNPTDLREELDIVAWDGDILVIVEVKTRDRSALVSGYFHVDKTKRDILRRAVRGYLKSLHVKPSTIRFEVVEIELEEGKTDPEIRHYSPVPLFGDHVIL